MEEHIEASKSTRSDKGFTLVELLIVIVILGVLATVTVFAVRGVTDQGKTSACNADKKTLEVAVEAYIAKNGGGAFPPPDEADLIPDYLHSESTKYDVVGGVVSATAGGDCV